MKKRELKNNKKNTLNIYSPTFSWPLMGHISNVLIKSGSNNMSMAGSAGQLLSPATTLL